MSAAGLARIKGAAIVFTLTSPGTYDPTTDSAAAASSSVVTGHAVRAPSDPRELESLQLTHQEVVSLTFVPAVPGQVPAIGAVVTWGGNPYTVRAVTPISLNGTSSRAKVVVAR